MDCVRSARAQTPPPGRILCIDDGSSDDTPRLLAALAAGDGVTVQVERQDHRGGASARNRGLALATSPYVQFLDADDLLRAGKLAHQLARIDAAATPPDLVAGAFDTWHAAGSRRTSTPDRDPWRGLVLGRLGVTSANLYRRETLLAIGGWNEGQASSQEYELAFRIMKSGGVVLCDDVPLTVKRDLGSPSVTNRDVAGNLRRYIELRHQFALHAERLGPPGRELLALARDHIVARLRELYRLDADLALELRAALLPLGYAPAAGGGVGWPFAIAHCLLGFERAERLLARCGRR